MLDIDTKKINLLENYRLEENIMTDTQNERMSKKYNKSYYFDSDKFVRDVVHGYVYLTKFDIDLISTEQFQRLRDIRQLTCQSVYPDARHTRFEHSLGVMELTRQALHNLNNNSFIADNSLNAVVIDEQLQFNAALAALLHDIGHCPFSHMGEVEFDSDEIWRRLSDDVARCDELRESELSIKFEEYNSSNGKKPGATHEQLSCIMILEKLGAILSEVKTRNIELTNGDSLYVDYELILRCILGIEYDTSTIELFEKNKEKNVVVNFINSKVFDMDKLDYVIRDSFYTGIGTPNIDTNRLFRNMYLNNENEYRLVFKNRAVPVLQNFIESRDGLYMYVYNHHTAVFSDFMKSYIFRRLAHNKRDLIELTKAFVKVVNAEKRKRKEREIITDDQLDEILSAGEELITITGMVSKDYLFSSTAIVEQNRSDSDLISLLNILHYSLGRVCEQGLEIKSYIYGEIESLLSVIGVALDFEVMDCVEELKEKREKLQENISHVYQLIKEYQCHKYLKPWWKTNSEFNNFLITNFKDDRICSRLCSWISQGKDRTMNSHEFRSQLAKNVIYITKKLQEQGIKTNLILALNVGDFFVIERSPRFFEPDTISELDIALKSNEILGSPKEVKYRSGEFYIKTLNKVIPQRDYYSMYAKNSFYIFSKRLPDDIESLEARNAHYHQIEQIFIFVAETLIADGERKFAHNYNTMKENENLAHEHMYTRFKTFLSK